MKHIKQEKLKIRILKMKRSNKTHDNTNKFSVFVSILILMMVIGYMVLVVYLLDILCRFLFLTS